MIFYASPAVEAVAVRRAVARAGCVAREVVVKSGHVRGELACDDGWGAARLLLALAIEDARTPGAQSLAAELRRKAPADADFARAVHALVKARVRFERETAEEFESGSYTLELGAGDCDAHFRLAYAVAAAGGLHAGLGILHHGPHAPASKQGPAHAVAVVELGGAWTWIETTVAADFGESPNAAARRLGLTNERSDIAKEIVIMTEKDLAPLPQGFRDRNDPAQVLKDAAALQRLGYLSRDVVGIADPTSTLLRLAVLEFQRAHGIAKDGLLGPTTRLTIAKALRAAGPAATAGLEYPGIGELVAAPPKASAHLTDAYLRLVIAMNDAFAAAGATTAAEDWLQIWTFESGIDSHKQTNAINPDTGHKYGNAGINQMGETERRATGFKNGLDDWMALSNEEQHPFVRRFYEGAIRDFAGGDFRAYRDAGSAYVATFAPAHLRHSGEPDFPLYSALKTPPQYAANRGLDHGSKGYISVDDMRLALERVASSPLFLEARDRVRAMGAAPARVRSVKSSIVGAGIVVMMLGAGAWAAYQAASS